MTGSELADPESNNDVNISMNSLAPVGSTAQLIMPDLNAPEQPVTTKKELMGWIFYDFASTVFPSVAMQVFIPLILERMAFAAGTQPGTDSPCIQPNSNTTVAGSDSPPCDVMFGVIKVPTVSFVLYVSAISVVIQALTFLSLGALADYGRWRKTLLIATSIIGSLIAISFAAVVKEDGYSIVATLTILANVAYGLTIIFYNAYLPVLVHNHPVIRNGLEEIVDIDKLENDMSFFGVSKRLKKMKVNTSSKLNPHWQIVKSFVKSVKCRPSKNNVTDETTNSTPDEIDAIEVLTEEVDGTDKISILSSENLHDTKDILARIKPSNVRNKDRIYIRLMTNLQDRLSNTLSTHGIASGHLAALIMMGVSGAVTSTITSTYGMQIAVALCGIWWFCLSFVTFSCLKSRPGPPLPPTEKNYIVFSWKKIINAFAHIKRLPNTFVYLVAYFVFSDAFTTIGQIAILFAFKTIKLTTPQITVAIILAPLFALLGGYFWLWLSRVNRWSTKTTLLILLSLAMILPIYGLLGYIDWNPEYVFVAADPQKGTQPISIGFGLKTVVEMFIAVVLFSFLLGPVTSFGRVLYTDLLPQGRESEFFSLYEITDRGTSWVGPLVVGAISSATGGDLRMGFAYVLVALVVGIGLIWKFVDVDQGKMDCADFAKEEREKYRQRLEEKLKRKASTKSFDISMMQKQDGQFEENLRLKERKSLPAFNIINTQ